MPMDSSFFSISIAPSIIQGAYLRMISGWTKASQARTASGEPGRIVLTGHGKDLLDDKTVQRTYLG